MNAKYILIFCALFALQDVVLAETDTPEIDKKLSLDLMKNIADTLLKLRNLAQSGIDDASKKLGDALIALRKLAEGIISKATEQIENIGNNEIKELRGKAMKLDMDLTDCIGDHEQRINNIPVTAIKELVKCVTDKIDEAAKIVADTITAVTSSISTVTGLDEALKNCVDNGSRFPCLLKVLGDVSGKLISLPATIATQVLKATNLVSTIQTALAICSSSKVAQVTVEIGKIGYGVMQCIVKKTLVK